THQPGVDTNQSKEWKKVPKRARRTKSAKPDAIIVRGSNEVSYADILRSVKAEPKLKELANHVRGIRKTAKGELLFELEKSADPITKGIHEAVQDFLGPSVEVIALTESSVIEVKDIDEVTSEEELLEALITQFGEVRITKSCIVSFRKAYGGTQTATLRLPVNSANKMVEAGKVRVGWVICRIRRKVQLAAQDLLMQKVRESRTDVAILSEPYRIKSSNTWVGDKSRKAAVWSCGQQAPPVTEVMAQNGFIRAKGDGSVIDLTFMSSSLAPRVSWSVSSEYTHSDHQAIVAEIHRRSYPSVPNRPIRYRTETLD
ncbi:hypothetical protein KR215_011401, partial [Drosophila sulfurigaster]